MDSNNDNYLELCQLDEKLMTNPEWEEKLNDAFYDHRVNYLFDLCKQAPEMDVRELIEFGEKLLKEVVS